MELISLISVIVCSRDLNRNKIHKEHIINSAGIPIEYILIDNSTNKHSLCSAYNEGVKKSNGDILLFLHDDVFIVTQNWAEIINTKFNQNHSMGALGVAGTSYLFDDDPFWCKAGRPFIKGKVIHENKNRGELVLTIFSDNNADEEVVALDGLFIAVRKKLFNHISFDSETFNGFHLYDLDISMQIGNTSKLYVTEDLLVKHLSGGAFGKEWKKYAELFLNKYRNELPKSCTSEIPDPQNRISFESPSLSNILKKETVDIIKAIGKLPKQAYFLYNSAKQYFADNNFGDAINILNNLLEKQLDYYDGWHLLGLSYFKYGDISNAIKSLQKALYINNKDPMLFYNLGTIFIEAGENLKALQYLNQAIQLKSDFTEALNKLTFILSLLGELTVAQRTCQTILKHCPNDLNALTNLGNILKDSGDIENAVKYYQRAIKLKPDNLETWSNLLMALHYTNENPGEIWKFHKDFGNLFSNIEKTGEQSKKQNRKLRIAYLSPDFRTHSVSYFIRAILKNYDSSKFEVICYNDSSIIDDTTKELKSYINTWKDIHKLTNTQLSTLIRNDNIDILIDLAGHSGNNRISLFTNRLATRQITYLGYPNTTGLNSMDYRISDKFAESEEATDFHSEKILKLNRSFLCYTPIQNLPAIKKSAFEKNNIITFGSFNNYSKISLKTIELWSQILLNIPKSKLFLKNRALNDEGIKRKTIQIFKNYKIDENRLILKSYANSLTEHLSTYNEIDISLDTYPYNGTTTTCEALSMGVPVITLKGNTHASRVGMSILSNCSLNKLVASSEDEYINIAKSLSEDYNNSENMKQNFKNKFLNSIICNPNEFMKDYESALIRAYYE